MAEGIEFFEKRIRPLLAEHCSRCHGAKRQENGLRLDSPEGILKGGTQGRAVVPSKPEQSLLIRAVRYRDDLQMPPKGKLGDAQIADLVAWVERGAPTPQLASDASPSLTNSFDLAERSRHWSYQPVQSVKPPPVKDAAWCSSPIDFFILARLEAVGLTHSPPAEKRAWLRRVTFDLIGLPPTPEEVSAFLKDHSSEAFAKVVDRLLASPHYGERWARHWLDLVLYSETMGYEFDYDIWNAWRYRDYVVRAFNADLPYDQLVVEHIAGDLVEKPRRHPTEGFNESILATGFFWMGEGKQTPIDPRQQQGDGIDSQLDVLGKAFLAQTIACARCHDHKFDAISTRDYYALAGYLKSSRYQQAFLDPPERIAKRARQLAALKKEILGHIKAERVPFWLDQAGQASRYLLAAHKVSGGAEAAEVARQLRLDTACLGRWVKALDENEVPGPHHPLFAWTQLAGPGKKTPEALPQGERALRRWLQERADMAAQNAGDQLFEDFRPPAYQGWFVTGDAFGPGPARPGDVVLGNSLERPIDRIITGGAHSGLLSRRLQGEMRSRTFFIDKPYLHFHLAGRHGRVNLVVDGHTLIMNPMYGGLTIEATDDHPAWRTMDVKPWLGHRAYLEITDSTIPLHVLREPPSDAREPQGPDGYITVDRICCSDKATPPPELPNQLNLRALERGADKGIEELAEAYQHLIVEELKRWGQDRVAAAPEERDGLALLDWLVHNDLLEGGAPGDTEKKGSAEAGKALHELLEKYQRLEASLPRPWRAPALADGTGEDESVFLRGNYKTLGAKAPRGLPEVLAGSAAPAPSSGSGRLELARRLVAPSNPLLARVLVNRLWQHHFGEGLVRTPDDFGRMGQAPTHPELLDYLAAELVRSGWSIKAMHRRMVLSSTYRMSSRPEPSRERLDPDNGLLHRMPVRRLEAEAIRDALLLISGRLERRTEGPSVLPYLTPYMEGRGRPKSGPLDGEGRRSLYLNGRRNFPTPLLVAFDYPLTLSTMGRRDASTVPAQALTLMNDPFIAAEVRRWSERLRADQHGTASDQVKLLYETAFARPPSAAELNSSLRFLALQGERYGGGPDDPRAWADLCHVLVNVKEFIFVN